MDLIASVRNDRVLLILDDPPKFTAGGILKPTNAEQELMFTGKVLAVGPGRTTEDGTLLPVTLKENDHVLFSKGAQVDYYDPGSRLLIMREQGIIAILED